MTDKKKLVVVRVKPRALIAVDNLKEVPEPTCEALALWQHPVAFKLRLPYKNASMLFLEVAKEICYWSLMIVYSQPVESGNELTNLVKLTGHKRKKLREIGLRILWI